MPAVIAILLHQDTIPALLKNYEISWMARHWEESGYNVQYLYGPQNNARADLCIVHVDLSLVPDAYIDFAHRFPVVLNGKVSDIRKKIISSNLVTEESGYDGPVIVKTDLNFAGWPEKMLTQGRWSLLLSRHAGKLVSKPGNIQSNRDYPVFDQFSQVPGHYLQDPQLVVEKFRPEIVDGFHCVNYFKFFGNEFECTRRYARSPVVVSSNTEQTLDIDVHEEVIQYRERIAMEFGKIDYCVNKGKAVIVDVNKTPGRRPRGSNVPLSRVLRRADGLRKYLE